LNTWVHAGKGGVEEQTQIVFALKGKTAKETTTFKSKDQGMEKHAGATAKAEGRIGKDAAEGRKS